jgi:hypothetical protein
MTDQTTTDDSREPAAGEPRTGLDEPRNVDRLAYSLYTACGLLLAIDVFVDKHGPFEIEHNFGFYALFGFAAYVALVVAAEGLRAIVMRPEDYYDR